MLPLAFESSRTSVEVSDLFYHYHADEITTLQSKGLVLGAFVSCGLASTPGKHGEAQLMCAIKVLDGVGFSVAADTYHASGGCTASRRR